MNNCLSKRSTVIIFIRKQGKAPNPEQSLKIATQREQLLCQTVDFHKTTGKLFVSLNVEDFICRAPPMSDGYVTDGEEPDMNLHPLPETGAPEWGDMFLPSTVSCQRHELPLCLNDVRRKEVKLRIAQAEEALEGIRHEIRHKSYLYQKDIRLAESTTSRSKYTSNRRSFDSDENGQALPKSKVIFVKGKREHRRLVVAVRRDARG